MPFGRVLHSIPPESESLAALGLVVLAVLQLVRWARGTFKDQAHQVFMVEGLAACTLVGPAVDAQFFASGAFWYPVLVGLPFVTVWLLVKGYRMSKGGAEWPWEYCCGVLFVDVLFLLHVLSYFRFGTAEQPWRYR